MPFFKTIHTCSFKAVVMLPALLAFLTLNSRAQLSDSIPLKEVTILGNRSDYFNSGSKIIKADSLSLAHFLNNNLASFLAQDNSIFIKSYGQGSLATSSIRGAGAAHTAVLWNGFNISSPMLGQLDLSLIPLSFIDDAAIQYGGTGTLWGSGSVGGNILLNNNKKFDQGLTLGVSGTIASFGTWQQGVDATFSKKKWISSTHAFYRKADNDFSYYNTSLDIPAKQKQQHAALAQYGLMQENYFRISKRQKLNLHFWFQDNNRQIPPNMLQPLSRASQHDRSYRISSEWQHTSEKTIFFLRSGAFKDFLDYGDSLTDVSSKSESLNWISEGEARISLHPSHILNAGINNTFSTAFTDAYKTDRSLNRTALFSSYSYTSGNRKLKATASVRQEFVKQKNIPLVWSAGSEWLFLKHFTLRGSINKIFRLPTLNDLYWIPGGNSKLLPESGYSEDAGLKGVFSFGKIQFSADLTVFNRNIENWITWLPGGGGTWSPRNIASVWSRGMETRCELKTTIKKLICKLGISTNYVVSTNEKAKTEDDESVGRQLIYVPMYSGAANFTLLYKTFYLSYNHTYTGYRYTSSDNYEYLEPYQLGNFNFGYSFTFSKCTLKLSGTINNAWNTRYEVISQQAMPLLNYQAGLSFIFNQPNKTIP